MSAFGNLFDQTGMALGDPPQDKNVALASYRERRSSTLQVLAATRLSKVPQCRRRMGESNRET